MSDQPKPATGGIVCPNCTMTIPCATGEWTADYVADRFTIDASSAGHIADAHNAALDAEREQVKKEGIAGRHIFEKLKEQLADEREKAQAWENHGKSVCANGELAINRGIEIAQLREQLDAERESHEKELDVVEANYSASLAEARDEIEDLEHTIRYLLDIITNKKEVHKV